MMSKGIRKISARLGFKIFYPILKPYILNPFNRGVQLSICSLTVFLKYMFKDMFKKFNCTGEKNLPIRIKYQNLEDDTVEVYKSGIAETGVYAMKEFTHDKFVIEYVGKNIYIYI